MRAQEFHRAGLGGAHDALFSWLQIVVAREVQPAVHEVEGKFVGKRGGDVLSGADGTRLAERGLDRDTDFPGDAVFSGRIDIRLPFERDHISHGWVIEKVPVQPSERLIREENERQFTGRTSAAKCGRVRVEPVDCLNDLASIETQTRVSIGD